MILFAMNPFPYRSPLILAAMIEEERALLEVLDTQERGTSGAPLLVDSRLEIGFREFKLGTGSLRIARSGVGPVNAAVTVASITRACPEIDSLVLLGVGGALSSTLGIGELIISTRVLQHDSFSSLDFGHPRMTAGQFILTAEDAAAHVAPVEACPLLRGWLASGFPLAKLGTVLSGNEFVGTVDRKKAIAALHGEALLVDMEAAGVAQIASQLKLPFVIAKTVADRLQPDDTIENDFRTCLESASRNAAAVLQRIL